VCDVPDLLALKKIYIYRPKIYRRAHRRARAARCVRMRGGPQHHLKKSDPFVHRAGKVKLFILVRARRARAHAAPARAAAPRGHAAPARQQESRQAMASAAMLVRLS
jgi:hypothetical protein